MATMNRIHAAFSYLRSNWRTIALCALVLYVLFHYRNQARFVPVPGTVSALALDTRTGQYCNPLPADLPDNRPFPKCSDLAKSWR